MAYFYPVAYKFCTRTARVKNESVAKGKINLNIKRFSLLASHTP